jgi:hypothetical protein
MTHPMMLGRIPGRVRAVTVAPASILLATSARELFAMTDDGEFSAISSALPVEPSGISVSGRFACVWGGGSVAVVDARPEGSVGVVAALPPRAPPEPGPPPTEAEVRDPLAPDWASQSAAYSVWERRWAAVVAACLHPVGQGRAVVVATARREVCVWDAAETSPVASSGMVGPSPLTCLSGEVVGGSHVLAGTQGGTVHLLAVAVESSGAGLTGSVRKVASWSFAQLLFRAVQPSVKLPPNGCKVNDADATRCVAVHLAQPVLPSTTAWGDASLPSWLDSSSDALLPLVGVVSTAAGSVLVNCNLHGLEPVRLPSGSTATWIPHNPDIECSVAVTPTGAAEVRIMGELCDFGTDPPPCVHVTAQLEPVLCVLWPRWTDSHGHSVEQVCATPCSWGGGVSHTSASAPSASPDWLRTPEGDAAPRGKWAASSPPRSHSPVSTPRRDAASGVDVLWSVPSVEAGSVLSGDAPLVPLPKGAAAMEQVLSLRASDSSSLKKAAQGNQFVMFDAKRVRSSGYGSAAPARTLGGSSKAVKRRVLKPVAREFTVPSKRSDGFGKYLQGLGAPGSRVMEGALRCCEVNPSGTWIAVGGWDGGVATVPLPGEDLQASRKWPIKPQGTIAVSNCLTSPAAAVGEVAASTLGAVTQVSFSSKDYRCGDLTMKKAQRGGKPRAAQALVPLVVSCHSPRGADAGVCVWAAGRSKPLLWVSSTDGGCGVEGWAVASTSRLRAPAGSCFVYHDRCLVVGDANRLVCFDLTVEEGGLEDTVGARDSMTRCKQSTLWETRAIDSGSHMKTVSDRLAPSSLPSCTCITSPSPTSTIVAFGQSDGGVHLVDLARATPACTSTLVLPEGTPPRYVRFGLPHLLLTASAARTQALLVWDLRSTTRTPVAALASHPSRIPGPLVAGACFSPCGSFVMAGGADRCLYTYDLRSPTSPLGRTRVAKEPVACTAWLQHPQAALCAATDATLSLWC